MSEPSADEQRVSKWAELHKISADCIRILWKHGFTSLEALSLLEKEDIGPKVPRGQHRLILHAVNQLNAETDPPAAAARDTTPGLQQPPTATPANNPDDPAGDDDCHNDPYISAVVHQLQSAQGASQPTGSRVTANPAHATAGKGATSTQNLSWNDSQVFLRMVAGKTAANVYYDITNFANLATLGVREEVVGSGTSGAQLVWRAGPRKPKLASLSIPQWAVANLAILTRLQEDGKLVGSIALLDYLSYTTDISIPTALRASLRVHVRSRVQETAGPARISLWDRSDPPTGLVA